MRDGYGETGRLLAFVRDAAKKPIEGWILYWEPPFKDEVSDSVHLEDHDFPNSNLEGLLLFEGYVYVTPGPEPDVEFHGAWRQLTHWEMLLVQQGLAPWDRT